MKTAQFLFLLLLSLASADVYAHKASDSFLKLQIADGKITGQWDIALRDLEYALGVDQNGDHEITWGEVRARESAIRDYTLGRLSVSNQGARIPLSVTGFGIERHSDGAYVAMQLAGGPVDSEEIAIGYELFFDVDAQHRGLLSVNGANDLRVFSPEQRIHAIHSARVSVSFAAFVKEGVWHIWKGLDHILFLLTLLLPAVIRYENGEWKVATAFRPVALEITKVVTAFTTAHSITLMLATLKIVRLPSALVESVIAASVVFGALNNIYPMVRSKTWAVAFGFGLAHGFGFANVFADLGLAGLHIIKPLIAFNLGVELGQLVIVTIYLPIAFLAREHKAYRIFGVQGASIAVALVAATWTFERALNFKILPF